MDPRQIRRRDMIAVGLGASALLLPARAQAALGTGRTLAIATSGGLKLGLQSYPQTLALGEKEVALTFDDGPIPGTTDRVLDALRAEGARATFFCIGRNAAAHPALARRIVAEGHTLAHHSFSHPWTFRQRSLEAGREDIERGFRAVEEAGHGSYGGSPRTPFFRYPALPTRRRSTSGWRGAASACSAVISGPVTGPR